MKPPTLAVLITYYNEGPLLTRCLESLRRQTRPVDSILIYDDASSVRPEAFVPNGMAVRTIRGDQNIGPARARNVLLRAASASWIHFHDADDAFDARWAERVGRWMDAPDVDAVFTEVRFVAEDGDVIERGMNLDARAAADDLLRYAIGHSMLVPSGTFRRTAIEAIGGYRETLWQSEDWDFHIRAAASGIRPRFVLDSLVSVHRRRESRSEQRIEVWTSALQAVELLASELPAAYRRDLSDAAGLFGSKLYELDARESARRAFDVASRLGTPALAHLRPASRALARIAGQETAEQLASIYRRLVPQSVRARLANVHKVAG